MNTKNQIRQKENKRKIFTFIDLFAGVGGLRIPFESLGCKCVFTCEIDKKACETYGLNFEKCESKDITKLDIKNEIPDFDILLAGFPCQAFSIAGYQKGFGDKGRGDLFFYIADILREKKPEAFLLENVKNLKSHDNGRTFKIISKELVRAGYTFKADILNATEYGNIPQNRERIYIVGFKDVSKTMRFEFPQKIKLTKNFKEFLEEDVDDKYYYNDKPLYQQLKDKAVSEDTVYQWRRKYVRENKKGVVPTLTANMGSGGHNVPIIKNHKGIRKLTPRETFALQGFPKTFKLPNLADSALYHQAGNSVVVPVVKRIARNMLKVLNS